MSSSGVVEKPRKESGSFMCGAKEGQHLIIEARARMRKQPA
jgi:hypothetical protein